jgi:hypothetical protein
MAVYVDNAVIPATAGGHNARWSHMTADTVIGPRIGLRADLTSKASTDP